MGANRKRQLFKAVGLGILFLGGVIVFVISVLHALPSEEPLVGRLLSLIAVGGLGLFPILISLGLWRRDTSAENVWRVTGRALGGVLLLGTLSIFTVYYQRIEGGFLVETWTFVTWGAGTGLVGGLLLGLYDLRREAIRLEAEQTADRLERIVNLVPIPLFTHDDEAVIQTWNPAAERVFGWDAEEIIGREYPLVPEEKRNEYQENLQKSQEGETLVGVETERLRKDGSRVDVQIWSAPLLNDGEMRETILALADISDIKERERSLHTLQSVVRDLVRAQSEQEVFERAIEAIDDLYDEPLAGCWVYNGEKDVLEPRCQTPMAATILSEQPHLGAGDSLAWGVFQSGEMEVIDDVRAEGDAYNPETEFRSEIILPLGSLGIMIIASRETAAFDESDVDIANALGAAMETAIQRVRREQDLELFKEAVENAGHSIYFTDPDGTIQYVNPSFTEMSGYSPSEAIGQTPGILKSGEHDKVFYEGLWESILDGDIWHGELINRRKSGDRYIIDQTIAPVTDEMGDIKQFVAISTDITKRQRRIEAMSVLNRVLRHNLRNTLNVILGRAALIAHDRTQTLESTLDNSTVEAIQSDAQLIVENGRNLMDLSKKAGKIKKVMDVPDPDGSYTELSDILMDEREFFQEMFPGATITVDLPEEQSVAIAADGYFKMAIHELLENALEHNNGSNMKVNITAWVPESDSVEITVADNGPGISEYQAQVIKRGAETPLLHGSGVGLWLVNWIIRILGGELSITDNEPTGTIIRLSMPTTLERIKISERDTRES